jgi:aspartyl-tRNA(Asn)/glutamyl-tRNA(Gln) amidotransferase subunit C
MNSPQLDVRYVANLARIDLNEEEVHCFEEQLAKVLEHVSQLGKLDLDGVEPTAHANPVFNVVRMDVSAPGLEKADALSNAPRQVNGLFAVTKVIE